MSGESAPEPAAGEPAGQPAPGAQADAPADDGPGQNAPADGNTAEPEPEPESGPWDGSAARVPSAGEPGAAGHEEPADAQEEPLEYDRQTSRLRAEIPKGSQFRDAVVGEVHHHYHESWRERRNPGRVPPGDLEHASAVHVRTPSDADLGQLLARQQVVFCRGAPGTGRSHSATVVLDRLTGENRSVSRVIVLDAAPGLEGLPGQLEAGCGHLLDGSDTPWAELISQAQLNQFRAALGQSGFVVIVVDTNDGTPLADQAVDHIRPDLGDVAAFHLAAQFLDEAPPGGERQAQARARARAVIEEARQADEKTRDWFAELGQAATAGPAEAVLFADVIWDWHRRKSASSGARPRVEEFRRRHRHAQAVRLLRRNDIPDSPLRQSYALSSAVLDGLALSEVIDGAANLAALLAEVEHPGEPGQREVFAQPLARWLRHVEIARPKPGDGNQDSTALVKMPSRELARLVIELAWREYDASRDPVLTWLMTLCTEHRDDRVRVRAVQALAFIAAHDYPLIKQRVLDVWSSPGRRRVERLAASWLLEAMVLDGPVADKVTDLLRQWSRSEIGKRAVAVRAYGTAIACLVPEDAIQGVRICAVLSGLGRLPELALCEMYRLGLTREVTAELTRWMQGFPVMRERAAQVLVRVARFSRIVEGEPGGPYDLLWLLAHDQDKVGASMTQLAELWLLACSQQGSRSDAWQMLGRWAQSCRQYRDLSGTFTALADEFEKAAGGDDLRGRLSVYRRRWNSYLDEETDK